MDFSQEEYLKELEYLVNIDSGSFDPEGTAKIAAYFTEKFRALGWQVTSHQLDTAVGPCLQITNHSTEQFDMLLIGHMDTVFTKGTAEKRPFSIQGNRAYGPGVVDMKASLLSVYYAVKHLDSLGLLEKISVGIAFNSDEELSSKYSRPWLERMGAKSKCALVLEPARADGSMVNTRRGVGRYTIEFKGVPSHSGVAPEKGISAINELAHWIIALHGLTNYEKGTNINVGVVKGGTTPNTVAEDAVASVDLRMKDLDEVAKIEKTIQDLLDNPKTPGIKVTVSGGVTRPPMNPTPAALELCKKVDEIAERLGVDFQWIATGGGSDANITAALGVPSIDGLGPIGSLSHTVEEYLEIDSIEPRLQLLCELMAEIADTHKLK
jgi:glutamate carboxypeptidase